jgi:hypothetical protein
MRDMLIQDRKDMLDGNPVSLASKWCISENDSLDRRTGAYKMFCDEMKISPRSLRKKYITPLRAYLKIVETYMCSGRWDEIDYPQVPSCAMKRLKIAFEKHSREKFKEFKISLKNEHPKVKINAKQLFPGELVKEIRKKGEADEICEAQWKILEKEAMSRGSLNKSVVVVDTSSSMTTNNFIPHDNAIALGLIISACAEGEWKNIVFTFDSVPRCIKIKEGTFFERCNQIMKIPWGVTTNLLATFRLILSKGIELKLEQKDMPEKLWILSDMQFDITEGYEKTNFQIVEELYKESGYTRPRIVFWNLNGSSSDFPVCVDDKLTSLISGFSTAMMKSVIEDKEFSPISIMRTTIDSPRYDNVRNLLESHI